MTMIHIRRCVRVLVTTVAAAWGGGCDQAEGDTRDIVLGHAEAVVRDSSTYDARDVRRALDGGWWVLSNSEPFVRRYDSAGALLARYGRAGRGPTDFLRPWQFVGEPSAGTSPLVWDVGRKRLVTLDILGQPHARHALIGALGPVRNDIESVTFGSPFLARSIGASVVWAQHSGEVSSTAHMTRPAILRLGLETGAVDTVLAVRGMNEGEAANRGATALVPIPLWDVCPDSTVAFLGADAAVLYRINVAGDTVAKVQIPLAYRTRQQLSDAALERHVRHLLVLEFLSIGRDTAAVGAEAKRIRRLFRAEFPAREPSFVRLLCDAASRIWLQRFSLDAHPLGYGDAWFVLSGEGSIRRVRMPDGFAPVQLLAREIIGLMEDGDGATWPARVSFTLER